MSLPDDLTICTVEDLVAMLEERKDAASAARKQAERLNAEAVVIEAHLMRVLGDGEAVQAPSGRILFKEEGALGAASVNKEALEEHAFSLPESLMPRQEWRYPGVTAIRAAEKAGELPDGLRADDLLIPAPSGSVLRWRTIAGVGEAA